MISRECINELLAALDGDDPDLPEQIRPLSYLGAMIRACETTEAAATLGKEDLDAWYAMVDEVRVLHRRAQAAIRQSRQEEGLP